MAVPLADYVKVKDNYCIAYLGKDYKAVEKLVNARQELECRFQGVRIYICTLDEQTDYSLPNALSLSELDIYKKRLAFIREINDVEEFLRESGVSA